MMSGIAVVGVGQWGPHLVRNFSSMHGSQTLWVVESDHQRREVIAERFASVATTENLADALDDDRVDAVVIATPTSSHASLARDALDAHKHVLVEKPLTNDLPSAVSLATTAEQRGLTLMVGHVFLFNAAVNAAKSYIDDGILGSLRYMSMVRTNLGPVRFDVNAAWDLASHDISIANYWLGSAPQAVSAIGGSWVNPGIEDSVFLTLIYPDNVLVHIEASWLNPRKRRLISVVGSDQMLTVDDMDLLEPLRIYDKSIERESTETVSDTFAGFRAQIREGQVVIPRVTSGEPLRSECEEFLRRIQGVEGSVSDGWAGVDVVATLVAADLSLRENGRMVNVDPR